MCTSMHHRTTHSGHFIHWNRLYGITSLQTWMYFGYGFKDGQILRGSVSLLW